MGGASPLPNNTGGDMNKNKILSLLLTVLLIVTSFTPVFAQGTERSYNNDPHELSVKTVEDRRGNKKNLIELSPLPELVSTKSLGQSGFRQAQAMRDVTINIKLVKHGIGSEDFKWNEVFEENGTFKVQAYYLDSQYREVQIEQAKLVTSTDSQITFSTKIPADATTINVKTSFIDNLAMRAYESDNGGAGEFNGSYNLQLDLYQIVEPKVSVVWENPYGSQVRGNGTTASFNNIKFNVPGNNTTINLRDEDIFDEDQDDIIDAQHLRDLTGKALEVTDTVDGKVTLDGKTYKVTTKLPTATEAGEIKFVSQPTVITPGDGENGGTSAPEGYVRVTFDPTSEGTIPGKAKGATKFYDVLEGTTWDAARSAKPVAVAEPGKPTHATKNFVAWLDGKAKLADKTGKVAQTTFTATYSEDVVPQEGEDKPNVPDNYVKVEFKADDATHTGGDARGTFEKVDNKEQTTIYWVNPEKEVDLTEKAPKVTEKTGYTHKGWDKALKATFTTATTITAQYVAKPGQVDEDPNDTDYIKLTFNANGGKIGDAETKDTWILKTLEFSKVNKPTAAKANATFNEWQDKAADGTKIADTATFDTDTTVYANYTDKAPETEKTSTPTITKPKAGDETISGTAEPNSKVKVKLPNNTEVETDADEDGNWTVNVPDGTDLKENDEVEAIATTDGKDPSDKATATVGPKETTPQTEADKYTPKVTPVEKEKGNPVTEDDVTGAVTVPEFVENPEYPGKTPVVTVDDPSTLPDGNTPGKTDVPVTVTYPDGSTDKVTVPVTITDLTPGETDAEKNPPVDPRLTEVEDKNDLTEEEKDKVKEEVKKVNPKVETVEVNHKGDATLIYPDGSTNFIPGVRTVYEREKVRPYDPGFRYEPSPDYLNKKEYKPELEQKAEIRELDVFSQYVIGNEDRLFMPYKGITRAEVAQIFARALRYDGYMTMGDYNPYSDVNANAWYYDAVVMTTQAGVFRGTDKGTFEPNREITKAELIATIARFQQLGTADGNSMNMRPDHWALGEVEAAYQEGWLDIYTKGLVNFDADMVITRAEVVSILNRAFGRIADIAYIDANADRLVSFTDVAKTDWFYYDVITAANTYAVYGMNWVNDSNGLDNEFTNLDDIVWETPLRNDKEVVETLRRVKFQRNVR